VFGLDGSFVASANGYPLGAQWRWSALANDGAVLRNFEWRWQRAMLQSPDGQKVVYEVQDPTSGAAGMYVREVAGPEHFVRQVEGRADRWLDAERVLVDPLTESGAFHAIDTLTGADQVVFTPPPPPTTKADGDKDGFMLSGDLRWAIFGRVNASGALLRQDLFDVARQSYVPGVSLGTRDLWVRPVGDMVLWVDGSRLQAMHLCDRVVVTLGTVASSAGVSTFAWSGDGRYASLSFGQTNEETGPHRLVVLDLQRALLAELEQPWGYVSQWSPDGSVVVLRRSGFHVGPTKLGRLELR
jgi:hypothetical protein